MTGEPGEKFEGARILHTMLRVKDIDKSIDFYTRLMGMKLLRRNDHPEGSYTLAFLGYGDEAETAILELTYNWGREEDYDVGTGYGHIAVRVTDIEGICEGLKAEGVNVPVGPKKRPSGHWLAFVEDPDGYRIELLQR